MPHRLTGWTAIAYAERHGGTLKKFTDPIERALKRVTVDKAKRVAHEDPRLIYMDIAHGNRKKKQKNAAPKSRSLSLRNFTGKVRLNPDKTVSVLGVGKRKKKTTTKRRRR